MSLSMIGSKLIDGLSRENRENAKSYVDEISKAVKLLNDMELMSSKQDEYAAKKRHKNDVIVKTSTIDLLGVKFIYEAAFRDGDKAPKQLKITEVKG